MNQQEGRMESEKIDDDTMLLTGLFQKAVFLRGDDDLSQAGCLEKYDNSIRATGRVLKLLGLAEPIERRVIGWKPTPRLISLLAEPGTRPLNATREWATYTHHALVELLLEAADVDYYDRSSGSDFACGFLEQLGLLRKDDCGDWRPTRRLVELVVEVRLVKLLAYFDKVPSDIFVPVMQKS